MNGEQAFRFAMANAERNADGSIVERSLVEIVARVVDFDADKERLGHAQRVVSARKRPGLTAPAGKVALPGLGIYEYEPDRLIADADGNVVENRHATVHHKKAEAWRSESAADRALERARQDRAEADVLGKWTEQQAKSGRDPRTLTFEVCLREQRLLDEDVAA